MHSKFKCSSYKKGRRVKSNTMALKFSDDYTKSSLGDTKRYLLDNQGRQTSLKSVGADETF